VELGEVGGARGRGEGAHYGYGEGMRCWQLGMISRSLLTACAASLHWERPCTYRCQRHANSSQLLSTGQCSQCLVMVSVWRPVSASRVAMTTETDLQELEASRHHLQHCSEAISLLLLQGHRPDSRQTAPIRKCTVSPVYACAAPRLLEEIRVLSRPTCTEVDLEASSIAVRKRTLASTTRCRGSYRAHHAICMLQHSLCSPVRIAVRPLLKRSFILHQRVNPTRKLAAN